VRSSRRQNAPRRCGSGPQSKYSCLSDEVCHDRSLAVHFDGARHHWQTLLTHVWPFLHFPQLSVAPQPFEVVPQFMPSPAHVTGVQPPVQTLLVQVCPDGQVPQLSVPPQPSEAVPQLKPSLMHVV